MHLPNDCLSNDVCWVTSTLSTGAVAGLIACGKRLGVKIEWPKFGLLAAGIFVAQMINFPVAAGTSGHLLGGAAAGIVLGPVGGALALATVLLLQCALLGDGGLTALGANALNMALIGVVAGWALDRGLSQFRRLPTWLRVGMAGSISVMLAAAACGWEIALSNGNTQALAAMTTAHWPVALVEGCVTAALVALLGRVGQSAVTGNPIATHRYWMGMATIGLVGIIALPLASTLPDALEVCLEGNAVAAKTPCDFLPNLAGLLGGLVLLGSVGRWFSRPSA